MDVLALFPTLSDLAKSMRQSCTAVTTQRVGNTIASGGGHSKFRDYNVIKEHPLAHTQRQPPDQVEKVVDELSELQVTCSSQSKPAVASSFTDGCSEMLPGCVGKYDQGTYLSDSAAVRLAQTGPSMTVAVPEEGSFVPFRRNMSGGVPLTELNYILPAVDDRTLSTVEEKSPIQSSDHLEVNFDTSTSHCVHPLLRSISSISSSSCESRPTSMIVDSEVDEEDRLLDHMKETVDLYHELYKKEKLKNRHLNKKLEGKEDRLKHKENKLSKLIAKLKLTQEVASENHQLCDKLTEEIALKKSQIQLLERQLISAQNERKRLNEHLEEVARQHRKLLQKYEQLLAEKDDGYYDKYQEAMKENQHLREQLKEHKEAIEHLQGQVDYLLESDHGANVEDSLEDQHSVEDHDSLGGNEDESTVTMDQICDNK